MPLPDRGSHPIHQRWIEKEARSKQQQIIQHPQATCEEEQPELQGWNHQFHKQPSRYRLERGRTEKTPQRIQARQQAKRVLFLRWRWRLPSSPVFWPDDQKDLLAQEEKTHLRCSQAARCSQTDCRWPQTPKTRRDLNRLRHQIPKLKPSHRSWFHPWSSDKAVGEDRSL